jgi:exopolysaccharide biosynthesis protein
MYWFLLMLLVTGCTLALPVTPTAEPTLEIEALAPGTWETLAPGLDRRADIPDDNFNGQLIVLRIDPALYTFRAHYRDPLNLIGWRDTLPEAVALVNANFFDPNGDVLGLLVSDGQVYGTPYTDRGGMFVIENGQPRIRSTLIEPYQGEALEQAVQAFPMLIDDGQRVFTDTTGDRATRRTVIATDTAGRVLLIVTPLPGWLLADLAQYMVESDYGIVDALNLDGGGSTMMLVRPMDLSLVSLDPVPAVLAVYEK